MSDSPKCPLCGEGMDDEQKPTCVLKQKRAAEDPTIPPEGPIMLSKDPISPPEGLSCSQRTLPTLQRAYHAHRRPYEPFRGHIMLSEDIIPVLQRAYHAHRGPYQPSRGPIMLSEDSTSPPKEPNSSPEGSVMLSEDLTSLSEGPIMLLEDPTSPPEGVSC